MQYAASDIHGCYDRYMTLLERLKLGEEDTLYLLGDLVDRGADGLKVLMDAVGRPNVEVLLGNHEYMAAVCLSWLMEEITPQNTGDEGAMIEHIKTLAAWQHDGGEVTLAAFKKLSPGEQRDVLDTLMELETWAETEAGGRRFLLVHAGLGNFRPDKALEDYDLMELLFARPDAQGAYFPDKTLVCGHTPTSLLRALEAGADLSAADPRDYSDAIYQKGGLIGVDCGCVFGGRLGCLCLDTMEEIYV